MRSFNAESSMCVGDAIVVVSIYILFDFLERSSLEDLCCSIFLLLGLALLYRRICAWLCSFLVIRVIDFVAPQPALIDQSSITSDFQLLLFFQVILFQFIHFLHVVKFPAIHS